MPMSALANDNWIGRMPFAFTPKGELLGDMTLKTLARGRMCVNKVIAEPERRASRSTKQGGLRGNTIAFPQGKVDVLPSSELPAAPDVAGTFMGNSVMIALAGAEKDDLHNAKWAQIPRQDYVDAARPILRCFSGPSLLNHNNISRGHTAFVIQLRSYL